MRKTGNAMWCVHKHISSGLVHGYETSQKLDREGTNVSMATRIEANEMFSDVVAAEKHLKKEIVPQLVAKGKIEEAKRLSELADKLRDSRQSLAQTNIFFLNDKMTIEGDPGIEVDKAVSKLERLLVKADEFAPMMEQEQMDCPRCEEDAKAIAETFIQMTDDKAELPKVHESSRKFTKPPLPSEVFRSIPKPHELIKEVAITIKGMKPVEG